MDGQTLEIPKPGLQERDFTPVLQRLRSMRERRERRISASAMDLLDRVRMRRSENRINWLKSKLRWFVSAEEIARIRANIDVETTMGREESVLWQLEQEAGLTGKQRITQPEFKPTSKQSREFTRMAPSQWQVDPLLNEDDFLSLKTGRDREEIDRQMFDRIVREHDAHTKLVTDKQDHRRHLRLLEIHRGEQDIVEAAVDVMEDIKAICMDTDPASSETPVQPAQQSAETDADFTPPVEQPAPVWG